jgi:lincosamide nucleotidyltransferase A/C/D/E
MPKDDPEMTANDVIEIARLLDQNRIDVWIDGGWGVDALLGQQTRTHRDLDIAVQHRDVPRLRALLEARGYKDVPRDDTRDCNFVLGDDMGHQVDVHSYTFDSTGNHVYGVEYPAESLTGTGSVNGYPVRCISPEWMVKFHTGYELDENDYRDVRALCQRFGIEMPSEYGKFETEAEAIKIRTAGPGDVDVIVRIYVDSWNASFVPRMPAIEVNAVRINSWRKDLAGSSPTRWWLAERGDDIVGFVGICPSRDPIDPDLGELDTIAVDPRVWRKGIGKALMSVALEGLRLEGYHSAILWTLSNYPQAENFYVATGWRLNGATRQDGQQVRYDHGL